MSLYLKVSENTDGSKFQRTSLLAPLIRRYKKSLYSSMENKESTLKHSLNVFYKTLPVRADIKYI